MNGHKAELNAFEKKTKAHLDDAKAKLSEIEAHAQSGTASAELAVVSTLQKAQAALEKEHQELHGAAESKAASIKAHLEDETAKLKTKIDALHNRVMHTEKAK